MTGDLQKRIGYKFKDGDLLKTAIIHKSFNEGDLARMNDNERLELLGDSVIDLIITDFLFKKYKHMAEGDLSKIKAHLVSTTFLYKVARGLGLGEFILLGKGEEKNRGRENNKIVASFFEAVVGALYLDAGFDKAREKVTGYFHPQVIDLLNETIKINDYKSELQELIQRNSTQLPAYVITESIEKNQTRFTASVFIEDQERGRGTGRSKKEAEHRAAYEALLKLDSQKSYIKLSEVFLLKND